MKGSRLRVYAQILLFTATFTFSICTRTQAEEVTRVGSHDFYSSFWFNLHERLRHEALSQTKEPHPTFNAEDEKIWEQSVDIYRHLVAPKHPIFSSDLVEWQYKIATSRGNDVPTEIPTDIREALMRAAVVYRKAQWKEDDVANRFWIAMESTLLRETGDEITKDLCKAYAITWPKLLHIEVTPFAEPFGGNTPPAVRGLLLTIISSRDKGNQCFGGLELMFHEPLHHFDEQMGKLLEDASKKVNKPIPRNLSHAILFYTSGEMTRLALLKRGVIYTTLASEVAQRAWPTYTAPLEKYWQAYLDGKTTEDEALQKLLTALTP